MSTLQEKLSASANKPEAPKTQSEEVKKQPEVKKESPKKFKAVGSMRGYQCATRIVRPNPLGYFDLKSDEEVAVFEALAKQGFVVKE